MFYLIGIKHKNEYITGKKSDFLTNVSYKYSLDNITLKCNDGIYTQYITDDFVLDFLNSRTSEVVSIEKSKFMTFVIKYGKYIKAVKYSDITSDIFCFTDHNLDTILLYNDFLILLNKFVSLESLEKGSKTVLDFIYQLCSLCLTCSKDGFDYELKGNKLRLGHKGDSYIFFSFELKPNFNKEDFEAEYLAYLMLRG